MPTARYCRTKTFACWQSSKQPTSGCSNPATFLYIPPGVAHDGVAVGDDCMTYSIGFRAPSRSELIADFADDLVAEMEDDDRYTDAGLVTQTNPGEISAKALDALHTMITEKLADREGLRPLVRRVYKHAKISRNRLVAGRATWPERGARAP